MQTYPTTYAMTHVRTWPVPWRVRDGTVHTVTQVTASGELACSCEAGRYGKRCWHRAFVKDGRAGKPRVRLAVPARRAFSEETRFAVASLDL